ncbi:MAG TPA: TMEM43 family protein [Xanthomonadaceae bacterium]|nr:TMEM43 family protein [Xanthomonadaceae bacterium]
MIAAARAAALACLLAVPVAQASADDAGSEPPRDPDFGVVARGAIGLERRVAMYQWHRDGTGYRKDWSERAIDSTEFVPGHENPPGIPLQQRRWALAKVTLGGYPVAPDAVEALARWEPLRPDFSALPGNLSATFQPEGDGLGSAANPVHPMVGDLRVTWRELRMPATHDALVLRDGRWELDERALARRARSGEDGTQPRMSYAWLVLGALAAALFAGLFLLLRRRRRS